MSEVHRNAPRAQLDREEYIEQAYFFRMMRDRIASNMSAQEILDRVHEEILSTTRLPMAIQFLATEVKHSGLLSSGFDKLPHYFTPFQAFVVRQTEQDNRRFSMESALHVLEREAVYRTQEPRAPGLFIFQFEVLSRNRLGYDEGMNCIGADPFFDDAWKDFVEWVRRQVGIVDFGDLIYMRSWFYVLEQRRRNPDYEPPVPVLFEEKEGKIAKASHGRDPLYLFAALQRQLNYPEVPRPKPRDDLPAKFETMQVKFRELEMRLKLLESEVRGQVDLSEFGKPDILADLPDEE